VTTLKVIDTATLQAERVAEYERLLFASCHALNDFRNVRDGYELGDGTTWGEVLRARRAFRKAHKAAEAAEVAAYGAAEVAARNAKIDDILEAVKQSEAAWRASPQFKKMCDDYENQKKHGTRSTQHAGLTVLDGGKAVRK
jgi:hypothetical protein